MKRFFACGLLLAGLTAGGIEKGSSRAAVIDALGEPQGSMRHGGNEILLFKNGSVTIQNGLVVETDLSPEYERQAEERALKARELQTEKKAESARQRKLYPEDHVIRMDCAYSKNESWNHLPETIRPQTGTFQYDLYIPQGYHDSEARTRPCLILESPLLWDRVDERIRKEKWITIILHDPGPQQTGMKMNSSFLAAYDDATGRFRISKDHLFIAGRAPASVFATMRPAAGIILHDPDFSGFERSGFLPDFLRLNKNLRAYTVLGSGAGRAHVDYQADFISKRIPKNYIGVYEGSTDTLPQPFADQALDWMKKEYTLP